MVHGPVAKGVGGGVAGTVLLLLQFGLEARLVHGVAVLGGDQLGQVDGEAVGVVEPEGVGAGDDLALLAALQALVHQADAAVKRAQEGHLLLADDVLDELLLLRDLRVGLAHVVHELLHEPAEERLSQAQEGVAVADGAAQDPADHVAGLHVGGQLAVGDAEADGADVVRDHAHRHVGLGVLAVFVAGKFADAGEHPGEHVGVVVAVLALQHGAEALEAHAGVDVAGGQRLQVAVGEALVLHEHEVPDLDDVRVGLVHQLAAGQARGGLLLRGADVDVDLGAGAAGAGLAHLPEVVVLVAQEDVVLGQVLAPGLLRLGVELGAVFGGAFEHGGVEEVLVDAVHAGQEFPGPVDGLGLEVVAEAPVAEHLEHRVVVGIVSDFFQVVVLAAHAQALLRVGGAQVRGLGVAQEDVLELVHAGVGEHQGGVVLDDHRRGRHDGVALGCEEVEEFLSDFLGGHISAN